MNFPFQSNIHANIAQKINPVFHKKQRDKKN